MPREKITTEQYTPTDNPNVVNEAPQRHLHVGFNRHGNWVQIGVELTITELERMTTEAKKQPAAINGINDKFIVWSDVIDRAETNNLIRQARRARDAAYGSDA